MPTPFHVKTTVLPGNRIEIASPDLPVGETVDVTVTPSRANGDSPSTSQRGTIAEMAAEISRSVPASEWAQFPPDASKHIDHHLYGTKRDDE